MQRFLLIIVFLPLLATAQPVAWISHRYFNDFDNVAIGGKWMNMETKSKGLAHAGQYFSKIYKGSTFSAGIKTMLPKDLARRNFNIAVYGWIRTNMIAQPDILVLSINHKDSAVFWSGENIVTKAKPGEWATFSFGMNVPQCIPPDSEVKIYILHKDEKSETDIDDLDIYFSTTELPSYLPR